MHTDTMSHVVNASHTHTHRVTDLFVHDLLTSSGYPMIIIYIYTHPVADNLSCANLAIDCYAHIL